MGRIEQNESITIQLRSPVAHHFQKIQLSMWAYDSMRYYRPLFPEYTHKRSTRASPIRMYLTSKPSLFSLYFQSYVMSYGKCSIFPVQTPCAGFQINRPDVTSTNVTTKTPRAHQPTAHVSYCTSIVITCAPVM